MKGYISKNILLVSSLLLILTACGAKKTRFRSWLESNDYRISSDSSVLVIEYKLSTCINCDGRIVAYSYQLQRQYGISDSNVLVVVDYAREIERNNVTETLHKLFGKNMPLIRKNKVELFLKQYESSIVNTLPYSASNAKFYTIKI